LAVAYWWVVLAYWLAVPATLYYQNHRMMCLAQWLRLAVHRLMYLRQPDYLHQYHLMYLYWCYHPHCWSIV